MNRFVAILSDGILEIHANGESLGFGYATFCGLDGADPVANQYPAKLPKNPKINCYQCIALIVEARRWSKKDLE